MTSRCACGKTKSKYAKECKACHHASMDRIYAENRAILETGTCPLCGNALRRNLALAGWWQCEQFGAETFRTYLDQPGCNFQMFIE